MTSHPLLCAKHQADHFHMYFLMQILWGQTDVTPTS